MCIQFHIVGNLISDDLKKIVTKMKNRSLMWILVPVIGIIMSILTESGSNIVKGKYAILN